MNTSEEASKFKEDYIRAFGDPNADGGTYKKDSRLAKAYEVALDIRKFEIELYWKRSGNFWLFVGGIAAALGFLLGGKIDSREALFGAKGRELVACFLCLAGFTVSFAWCLVNKGSKFWQRNWEYQVDILEQAVLGPLYKTVFSKKDGSVMYSVSKINILVSQYVCFIFLLATIFFLIGRNYLHKTMTYVVSNYAVNAAGFDMDLIFLICKIFVFAINCAAILYYFLKVRSVTVRSEEFDVDVEASVRYLEVKNTHGSEKAKGTWIPEEVVPATKSSETRGISKVVYGIYSLLAKPR